MYKTANVKIEIHKAELHVVSMKNFVIASKIKKPNMMAKRGKNPAFPPSSRTFLIAAMASPIAPRADSIAPMIIGSINTTIKASITINTTLSLALRVEMMSIVDKYKIKVTIIVPIRTHKRNKSGSEVP
jgi:hypothetical protein